MRTMQSMNFIYNSAYRNAIQQYVPLLQSMQWKMDTYIRIKRGQGIQLLCGSLSSSISTHRSITSYVLVEALRSAPIYPALTCSCGQFVWWRRLLAWPAGLTFTRPVGRARPAIDVGRLRPLLQLHMASPIRSVQARRRQHVAFRSMDEWTYA